MVLKTILALGIFACNLVMMLMVGILTTDTVTPKWFWVTVAMIAFVLSFVFAYLFMRGGKISKRDEFGGDARFF